MLLKKTGMLLEKELFNLLVLPSYGFLCCIVGAAKIVIEFTKLGF
jgi:hypothetical protein